MAIEVIAINEKEDGSADVQFDVSDEQEVKQLVSEGLNFLLLKAAYGLTTKELTGQLESISKLKDFLDTLDDTPQGPEVIDKICGIVHGRTDISG